MTDTHQASDHDHLIYIIAGEASGDHIGASIMAELHHISKAPLTFQGIGGPEMTIQGLKSLFPMSELSIMGLLEIIPHALNIMARLNQTVDDIKRLRPKVIVTIDSPGFCFRLAKRIKALNIPVVHINAPTVWAWRPRRAEKITRYISHLLTLFPFEPPYFTKHGLKTTFMGHPLAEKHLGQIDGKEFRKRLKLKAGQPLLCVLPGSRDAEIKMHLPIFLDTVELLKIQFPDLVIVVPTIHKHKDTIETEFSRRGVSGIIVTNETEKYEAMRTSTAALAASGTVTLELGLCETPMIVAYKGNAITAAIVRRLLITKYVSLVNILLNKEVVPEFLQENCKSETLSLKLHKFLKDGCESRTDQMNDLKKLQPMIEGPDKKSPSHIAANVILDTMGLVTTNSKGD